MIKDVNHASFTVSNLEKSVLFYSRTLGLKTKDISERDPCFSEKVTGIKGAHLKIAYLDGNNCSIELIQYLKPKGKKLDTTTCNVGAAHICFNVDNFNKFYKNLWQKGVKFVNEPAVIPAGPNKGRYVVYLKDPDQNTLEFISTERVEE